jgi:hypothetical protein
MNVVLGPEPKADLPIVIHRVLRDTVVASFELVTYDAVFRRLRLPTAGGIPFRLGWRRAVAFTAVDVTAQFADVLVPLTVALQHVRAGAAIVTGCAAKANAGAHAARAAVVRRAFARIRKRTFCGLTATRNRSWHCDVDLHRRAVLFR